MLLENITSRELTEWQAYEYLNGPLDDSWRDESQALQVDMAHDLLYLTGQAHFTDKSHKNGPIDPRESSHVRPRDVYKAEKGS